MTRLSFSLLVFLFLAGTANGQPANKTRGPKKPAPTQRDVRYGPHERNFLDFWQAKSSRPTPLVVYIHGGGFRAGDKNSLNARVLGDLLDAGISVAAIHYRLLEHAKLPAAHHDSRRAIQFLRSKEKAWNLDPGRLGAFGGSAGAQICMWLAFHDDMAAPEARDPIERISTRLQAVATNGGQTTMDLDWWMKNIPGYESPHRPRTEYFGDRSEADRKKVIADISALSLISADDPPIYMTYGMRPDDPIPEGGRARGWKVHHVNFGVSLKEKMDALGVEADLKYPGAKTTYSSIQDFFIRKLRR